MGGLTLSESFKQNTKKDIELRGGCDGDISEGLDVLREGWLSPNSCVNVLHSQRMHSKKHILYG